MLHAAHSVVCMDYNASIHQLSLSTGSSLCSEIKFAVYMFIGTHWTACLWYFIACPSIHMAAWESHTCGEDTWAYRYANYTGIPLSKQSCAIRTYTKNKNNFFILMDNALHVGQVYVCD